MVMKVVLLDGSPAAPSRVGVLLATIAEHLQIAGHTVSLLDLRELALPINDPAYHLTPDKHPDALVRKFVAAIKEADALVLGTPMYHGSYSGLLKSALDHLDNNAFKGKAVGLASNATGPRSAVLGAMALVPVVRALKGHALNRLIGTHRDDYGEKDGVFQITEPLILERIKVFTDELVQLASAR